MHSSYHSKKRRKMKLFSQKVLERKEARTLGFSSRFQKKYATLQKLKKKRAVDQNSLSLFLKERG